ncbi:sulfite exporter TauE/SafE family protein [Phaeobacter sp. J2-8]|uniref:sulfite exporter TauE/SafE family protein n=1 Tax=Phaeobacter sp. J2-8 TaxID=2931394 RepID=UPI001FD33AFA|nr:sulfite exporter TauE/SafE family protein [Phaeobacter sp. J2-8]MCJ7871136.1 sulfite exporter TauE/SafE family protein [Phaeobacter sp. J2-8]
MDFAAFDLSFSLLMASGAVALLAGVIKGMVGFAMPMIMISLLGMFLPPDVALAGLILPTLLTNGAQALRQGLGAAWRSAYQFRIYLLTAGVVLVLSAQLYVFLPVWVLFLSIGLPITLFCLMQLVGMKFHLPQQIAWVEVTLGTFSGFIGGLSGVWGPPMVAYLTALQTEKRMQMRTQGVAFGFGSLLLLLAHWNSGVVRSETFVFSIWLCLPAMIGVWLGGMVQDRIDQETFRRATLAVLLLAGLNLLRRAYFA